MQNQNVITITNYTVSTNKYGAIDVHFNERPGKSVLDKMKDKGFRYFKPTQVWSTFKFKSEADCLAWLNQNGITNDIVQSKPEVVEPKPQKTAKKSVSKPKTDNSTTTNQKVVKSSKTKVLEQVSVQPTMPLDKYDECYKHFEAQIKEEYSEVDRQTKSLFISISGNGYAVLDTNSYLNLPKATLKAFDKQYIAYGWR